MNRWYGPAIVVLVAGLVVTFRLPWGDCDQGTAECGEGLSRFFVGSATVILTVFLGLLGLARGRS